MVFYQLMTWCLKEYTRGIQFVMAVVNRKNQLNICSFNAAEPKKFGRWPQFNGMV